MANFAHPPNADAALWFADAVLPLVRADMPDITFHIVGADPPATLADRQGQGIVTHGWVADLTALYARVRLSVAPLRFGAGLKGKVAGSLAQGVPVIATTVAVEGMGLAEGDGVAIADEPEAFARALLHVYRDASAWSQLSSRARAACASLYAPERAREILRVLLRDLGLPVRGR